MNMTLALSELGQSTLRQLTRAWFAFERRLALVPIVRRLDLGSFTLTDYQTCCCICVRRWLKALDGSVAVHRASTGTHSDIRSVVLGHATTNTAISKFLSPTT